MLLLLAVLNGSSLNFSNSLYTSDRPYTTIMNFRSIGKAAKILSSGKPAELLKSCSKFIKALKKCILLFFKEIIC